jgi:hypothetical protein
MELGQEQIRWAQGLRGIKLIFFAVETSFALVFLFLHFLSQKFSLFPLMNKQQPSGRVLMNPDSGDGDWPAKVAAPPRRKVKLTLFFIFFFLCPFFLYTIKFNSTHPQT